MPMVTSNDSTKRGDFVLPVRAISPATEREREAPGDGTEAQREGRRHRGTERRCVCVCEVLNDKQPKCASRDWIGSRRRRRDDDDCTRGGERPDRQMRRKKGASDHISVAARVRLYVVVCGRTRRVMTSAMCVVGGRSGVGGVRKTARIVQNHT